MVCGHAGWTTFKVSPLPSGSEGPGLQCASPTPHRGPGQDNGCLCPASRIQRAGPTPAGSPPAVPAATPSWDHACQAAWPSQGSPCPRELQPAVTWDQGPPGPGEGAGALTTVLLRWLCTVKSGQKSRSAMARSRDSARGRAFSSSSSPCLGHGPQRPLSRGCRGEAVPGLGEWWRTGLAQAGTHGGGREEVGGGGTGSGPLITPKPPKAEGGQWGAGPGSSQEASPLTGRGQVSPLNSRASALLRITGSTHPTLCTPSCLDRTPGRE